MKRLIFLYSLVLMLFNTNCTKNEDFSKEGVSLPSVTNLKLQKAGNKGVKLTWNIPASIPEDIRQPLSVHIEVREIVTAMKAVSIFTNTLPNAPSEFNYDVPDASKSYHFTVKLYGTTKVIDKNYSSGIYSLGQTVAYN